MRRTSVLGYFRLPKMGILSLFRLWSDTGCKEACQRLDIKIVLLGCKKRVTKIVVRKYNLVYFMSCVES